MKDTKHYHTVVMTFEVDAVNWEDAGEQVLRTGFLHLTDCVVQQPGEDDVHINPASIARAAAALQSNPPPEGE